MKVSSVNRVVQGGFQGLVGSLLDARWQWQPTSDSHDPNPPLTLLFSAFDSSLMRAELQKVAPQVQFVLEITKGDTTTYYSENGSSHLADGLDYRPRILSIAPISRGVSLRDNTLELPTVEVMLDDTDQEINAQIGASRIYYRNATATIKLASPNVDRASWWTLFAGVISSVGQPAPLVWQFTITPNDLPLRRDTVPRLTIERSDWPNCPIDSIGTVVPMIYGKISSQSDTNTGAVPTFYVDSTNFYYLICVGALKSVDYVYKDGVLQSSSLYTVTRGVVNGRLYTYLDFTSTQGTGVITCDVQGYEDVGDGTGTLIDNPPDMLKHLLDNFIYSDYTNGNWSSTDPAPCDSTAFATTFFSDRDYSASYYIDAKRKGIDIINDFLASFQMKGYWTSEGQLAVAVEDFTDFSYEEDNVVRETDAMNSQSSWPSADVVDEIKASYAFNPAEGGYAQALRVIDRSTGEGAPEELDLPCSGSFIL